MSEYTHNQLMTALVAFFTFFPVFTVLCLFCWDQEQRIRQNRKRYEEEAKKREAREKERGF